MRRSPALPCPRNQDGGGDQRHEPAAVDHGGGRYGAGGAIFLVGGIALTRRLRY
jgi:hypothetical protein